MIWGRLRSKLYLTSISTNATQVLYTVLSKLPSSVIELLTATNGN